MTAAFLPMLTTSRMVAAIGLLGISALSPAGELPRYFYVPPEPAKATGQLPKSQPHDPLTASSPFDTGRWRFREPDSRAGTNRKPSEFRPDHRLDEPPPASPLDDSIYREQGRNFRFRPRDRENRKGTPPAPAPRLSPYGQRPVPVYPARPYGGYWRY